MDFDAFVGEIVTHGWKVWGAEVYRDGCLIHSFGDTRGAPHEIYSAAKSVLSVALGIARDRGLIDFERPVLAYLPAAYRARMPMAQRGIYERLPLRRLMTMSVGGLPFRPSGVDWLDDALSQPIADPWENAFNYNNICAYLAGVALTEALGTDAGRFIEEEVFAPLGIADYAFSRSPEGYFYGASGMKLSVHDLSRIGLLMVQGGTFGGRRIVSEAYVREATAAQQPTPGGGYGYFFWRYRDGYSINGKWKQRCYVLPEQGLVITHLADIRDSSVPLTACVERYLLDVE